MRALILFTFWTNTIIYQVFGFIFIQSSFIPIGVGVRVFAINSFFRWHNNLPSFRLHLYSVILHSDRSRSRSFCNQFLFFVGLNFLSSLTTRKLTWYLAFLTKGDMLTTRNPHFTKIFTYFRPVSQKNKKKNSKIQLSILFIFCCLISINVISYCA